MIVLTHASNVTGTLLPIREVGEIARKQNLLFLVDAAQTAGAYPIDVERDAIDLLAFTGHKSLYGPQGTGGLVIGERVGEKEMVPSRREEREADPNLRNNPIFCRTALKAEHPMGLALPGFWLDYGLWKRKASKPFAGYEMGLIERMCSVG